MIDKYDVENLSQLIVSQDLPQFKKFCNQNHNLLSSLEENQEYFTLFYQKLIDNSITIDMIKYLQEMNSKIFNNQNINSHFEIVIRNDCINIFTYFINLFESLVTKNNWAEYLQLGCKYLSINIFHYLLFQIITNQKLITFSDHLNQIKVSCLDNLLESWWDDLAKFNDNAIINIQKEIYDQMFDLLFPNIEKTVIKDYLKTLIYNKKFKNNNINSRVIKFKIKKISDRLS